MNSPTCHLLVPCKAIAKMIDTAAETGRKMGFAVRTFDGYALDMTLGDAAEKLAVLGHLDVVPVGDGWVKDPFGGEIEDGKIYGRGTNDDKGPSLAALYAMKAIREAGIPLRRSIRLILGGDEECDWECMHYYAAHAEMPEMGFSPDASFPLINTEKGMLHFELRFPEAQEGLKILRMATGERPNVIAGESKPCWKAERPWWSRSGPMQRKPGCLTARRLRRRASG